MALGCGGRSFDASFIYTFSTLKKEAEAELGEISRDPRAKKPHKTRRERLSMPSKDTSNSLRAHSSDLQPREFSMVIKNFYIPGKDVLLPPVGAEHLSRNICSKRIKDIRSYALI